MKREKLVKAITKLIYLTQQGTIKWKSYNPVYIGNSDLIKGVFELSLLDSKFFRLIGYWETLPELNGKSVTLEMFDANGTKIYKFPYTNAMIDLYNCLCSDIEYEMRGENILDKIIDESIFK